MRGEALLRQYEASSYIINMTPYDGLLRTGIALGLSETTTVLDLCCGYGEMLKVWCETFGCSGTGVDLCHEFVQTGNARLEAAGIASVNLIEGDARQYTSANKHEVVCCTETLGSISETLALMQTHAQPGGKLVFCHVYSKVPHPPQELIDYEGPMPTLDELYTTFRHLGFYVTSLVSETTAEWDRYISWSARRDVARLRQSGDEAGAAERIDRWWHMYFAYRRPYEGQAMFVLERP